MDREDKCCGNCTFNRHDPDGWYCGNSECEHYADYTDYDDYCEDWEGR